MRAEWRRGSSAAKDGRRQHPAETGRHRPANPLATGADQRARTPPGTAPAAAARAGAPNSGASRTTRPSTGRPTAQNPGVRAPGGRSGRIAAEVRGDVVGRRPRGTGDAAAQIESLGASEVSGRGPSRRPPRGSPFAGYNRQGRDRPRYKGDFGSAPAGASGRRSGAAMALRAHADG